MVTVIFCNGTPVSLACISISVTPQEETAPRNASLLVKASGCGREDESSGSDTPRTSFFARPMVPLLDEAMISIEVLPGDLGGSLERAREHYLAAVKRSGGVRASAHVTWASTAAVAAQDRAGFRRALEAALAIDPDASAPDRLANRVAQARARVLLARADVVSLHAGVSAPERPLLGLEEIAAMKPGAILINTARGNLVDEIALAGALRSGRLGGAGLDVFAAEPPYGSPFFGCDNVVLTPHIGGQTQEGLRRMGDMTAENCLRALRGEPPLYQVS